MEKAVIIEKQVKTHVTKEAIEGLDKYKVGDDVIIRSSEDSTLYIEGRVKGFEFSNVLVQLPRKDTPGRFIIPFRRETGKGFGIHSSNLYLS